MEKHKFKHAGLVPDQLLVTIYVSAAKQCFGWDWIMSNFQFTEHPTEARNLYHNSVKFCRESGITPMSTPEFEKRLAEEKRDRKRKNLAKFKSRIVEIRRSYASLPKLNNAPMGSKARTRAEGVGTLTEAQLKKIIGDTKPTPMTPKENLDLSSNHPALRTVKIRLQGSEEDVKILREWLLAKGQHLNGLILGAPREGSNPKYVGQQKWSSYGDIQFEIYKNGYLKQKTRRRRKK